MMPSWVQRPSSWLKGALLGAIITVALGSVALIQQGLELRRDRTALHIEELRFLPPGQYLKPVLLGYHHLAADVLWLRVIQVIGKRDTMPQDYEWLYHALDVITTLDPQYDYAYQVGGIVLTQLADRVDLSNKILEKGLEENPAVWQIPFYLGFNQFFYLHDYAQAAEYMTRASRLPGHPPYLPFLATRLYAEAGSPETALTFLTAMWRQTQDEQVKELLEYRMKEVIIERDIRILEDAVGRYREQEEHAPPTLSALVNRDILREIPAEPFGGEYRLNPTTGEISSSTHPERLRLHRRGESGQRTQEGST